MKEEAKELNKKIAEHLKKIRQDQGETMRVVSSKIGISHAFIGKIEQQGRRLDVGEYIHYCRALDKDPVKVLRTILDSE